MAGFFVFSRQQALRTALARQVESAFPAAPSVACG